VRRENANLANLLPHFENVVLFFEEPSDAFGGDLWPIVVVESDGSYRLLDVLAICEEGVTETNLHVTTDPLSKYLDYTRSYYPPPSATCRNCEAFTACGGGYLAHRFDGKSYDNPSFYCEVLLGMYRHIRRHLEGTVDAATWQLGQKAAAEGTELLAAY